MLKERSLADAGFASQHHDAASATTRLR